MLDDLAFRFDVSGCAELGGGDEVALMCKHCKSAPHNTSVVRSLFRKGETLLEQHLNECLNIS